MNGITEQQKHYLFRETEGRCIYCGAPLTPDSVTCDHIRPRALGGENSIKNYVACCEACNKAKGDSSLDDFLSGFDERRLTAYHHRVDNLKSKGYISREKAERLEGRTVPVILSRILPGAMYVRRGADVALTRMLFGAGC